jgi:hypothetical protein
MTASSATPSITSEALTIAVTSRPSAIPSSFAASTVIEATRRMPPRELRSSIASVTMDHQPNAM